MNTVGSSAELIVLLLIYLDPVDMVSIDSSTSKHPADFAPGSDGAP
jgi:hypothetical protein